MDRVPCPDCEGEGWVLGSDDRVDNCPTCDGTGEVDEDDADPTRW